MKGCLVNMFYIYFLIWQQKEIVASAIFSLIPFTGFAIYSNTTPKKNGCLPVENAF